MEQSGENRAEVPLGPSGSTGRAVVPLRAGGSTGLRGLFVPGRNFEPKISRFRGANGKIRARNARERGAITQAMKSLDQNHKKLTQTRDRSRDQGGAFYEIFRFLGEKRFRGEILGNQKLLIPICCG